MLTRVEARLQADHIWVCNNSIDNCIIVYVHYNTINMALFNHTCNIIIVIIITDHEWIAIVNELIDEVWIVNSLYTPPSSCSNGNEGVFLNAPLNYPQIRLHMHPMHTGAGCHMRPMHTGAGCHMRPMHTGAGCHMRPMHTGAGCHMRPMHTGAGCHMRPMHTGAGCHVRPMHTGAGCHMRPMHTVQVQGAT